MNKYIKIFGLYIGIELVHYAYLLYWINSSNKKIGDNTNDSDNVINNIYNKKKLIKKNFYSILNENYINNKNYLEMDKIYYNIANLDFNVIKDKNFALITPYSVLLRMFFTCTFLNDLAYYVIFKKFGFEIDSNTIILHRKSLNPNSKLIMIHTGMLGNICWYKNLVNNLDSDYSIIICVFRSTISTFFWNNADIDLHVLNLNEFIKKEKDIILISHSFGAFVVEYMLKKFVQINYKVHKEILIQPGNVLSMGLIFLSSTNYNFISYFNFINKYSSYIKHNFILTWMLKSLAGKSTISSIKTIDGVRLHPRNFKGYLIISDNDPLINGRTTHPAYQEIQYIFPNYKIISNNAYHGYSNDKMDIILKCIKE